jgi:hypothetical protein
VDTSNHNMKTLFEQLGLSSNEVAIENFIYNNHVFATLVSNDNKYDLC